MVSNELVSRDRDDMPAIADDFLIHVAEQAERRIDAVIKIKQTALKVTNPYDWMNQQDRPYLQASGSEKIANLFNISWRIGEPQYEEEPDGHFTYAYKGEFSLGGRTIEVEGTRSSKDPFFNKYDYTKEKDKAGKFPTLPPSAIDKGDVKKAALTNLYGNGITRILGIRNLTWEELEKFAGIKKDQVQKIGYKTKDEQKPPITAPQSKSEKKTEEQQSTQESNVRISLKQELANYCKGNAKEMAALLAELSQFETVKDGKPVIHEIKYLSDIDNPKVSDKWLGATLGKLRELAKKQVPPDCTKNPTGCEHSIYTKQEGTDEMLVECEGKPCPFSSS